MNARKHTRGQQAAAAVRSEDIVKPSNVLSDYEAVARLIMPEPPAWLAETLHSWSASVRLQAGVTAFQPSRARMRAYLRWFESTALALTKALGEPPVREFLDAAGEGKIAYHGDIDAYLRDLGARAARALASPELATPAGKTKAGKGPALPPGAVHSASLCALIIVDAWKYAHGAYPGARNAKATEAAEAYWRACGNTRISWGTNPLTAWRRRFEEAMSPSFDPHRGEVVRHLRESERLARFLAKPRDPGVDSNQPPEGAI